MKSSQITKSIKSSVKKHYVKKTEFDALKQEVKQLAKALAKHKKGGHSKKKKPAKAKAKKPAKAKSSNTASAAKTPDILTNIKGIGPVIEKKLHAAGVVSFQQIADWTTADVDKFSAQLAFKGRIEREEWVKQAKALTQ